MLMGMMQQQQGGGMPGGMGGMGGGMEEDDDGRPVRVADLASLQASLLQQNIKPFGEFTRAERCAGGRAAKKPLPTHPVRLGRAPGRRRTVHGDGNTTHEAYGVGTRDAGGRAGGEATFVHAPWKRAMSGWRPKRVRREVRDVLSDTCVGWRRGWGMFIPLTSF